MIRQVVASVMCMLFLFTAAGATAQEAEIHHGFLFFAGEKYEMDEETFGVYEDGHKFEDLIKDNATALSQFQSYETWHTVANVTFGLSLAAVVFGGFYYMFEKDMSETLGESTGIILFATGGGLMVMSFIFEFISWGSITSAAESYNGELMDEGPALKLPEGVPLPTVAATPDGGAHLALTWRF